MCEEHDFAGHALAGPDRLELDRRQFGAMAAAASLAACAPMERGGAAGGIRESAVQIPTPDGTMDAVLFHPAQGSHPAVIFWPDVAGVREAKRLMARRLAGSGHSVLLVNPYYRDAPAPQFADFAAFRAAGMNAVSPWRAKLTPNAIMSDAKALVSWLDKQQSVDRKRGIGVQGYCMSGPFTIWCAAAVPDRIKAAASFHGGGLVREDAQSPHRMMTASKAQFLIAIAQNDDAKEPEAKAALRQAADAAGRPAEIEVYAADHGWCVPDSPAYDQAEAERAWTRLLALYGRAL